MPNKRHRGPRHTHAQESNLALTPTTPATLISGLDWSCVSKTRQHFVDSVCLLSLLSKQQTYDDSNDDQDVPEDTRGDHGEDDAQDDEDFGSDEDWNMWNFWPEGIQRTEESHLLNLARLRDRFLDRLSEVLARIKDPPEAVRQISSAYLCESGSDPSNQSVQIRVFKNDGFSEQDEEYLETLRGCLEHISQGERPADEVGDIMMNDVLNYARPRLTHYIKILEKEFNRELRMPSDNLSDLERFITTQGHLLVEKKWKDSTWRSYKFPLPACRAGQVGDDRAASRKRAESFQQIDENTGLIFDTVKQFCNPMTPDSEKDVAKLIKSTYKLYQDLRCRATFNSHFNRHFQHELGSASRARQALLFMCRFYSAVSTFSEVAQRIPSFRKVSFVRVQPPGSAPSQIGPSRSTVANAMAALGFSTSNMKHKYFRGAGAAETAINLRCNKLRQKKLHVHAEIQLVDDFEKRRAESTGERRVHPYIGGSKLCCYLCYRFLHYHGFFQYRGCHRKLYPQWTVPELYISDNAAQAFQECLRHVHLDILERIKSWCAGERVPSKEHMMAESTIDLSSVMTMSSIDSPGMAIQPRISSRLFKGAYGPMVFDDAVLSFPLSDKPGRVFIRQNGQGREMSVDEADMFKDTFERKKLLQKLKGMKIKRRCHGKACKIVPTLRCKSCRTSYCSRSCQRRDWHRHVFVCTVRGRPSLADFFVYLIRESSYLQDPAASRKQLLDDADISKAFGFNDCATLADFNNLFCLYRHLIFKRKVNGLTLQEWIGSGKIRSRISDQMSLQKDYHCQCHDWFATSSEVFRDRSSGTPSYVEHGFVRTLSFVRETDANEDKGTNDKPPSSSECRVFRLYFLLLKDFDNVPDTNHPQWLDFGFCFCRNNEWRKKMVGAYFELAKCSSIAEIARSWEESSYNLDNLFFTKGIDISKFQKSGISFGRPSYADLGIYRVMVEVQHFRRGTFCACSVFNGCRCKRFPESRLSIETVMDYGFDILSPWERWQMIQLYAELFTTSGFDVGEMLAARRNDNPGALQRYVEKMVDVRKFQNKYKAGALFPDLRGKIIRDTSVLPRCYCICH